MSNTIVPSAVHMAGLRWGRNETYIDTEKKTSFIKIIIKTSLTAYNQVSNMTVTSLLTYKKNLISQFSKQYTKTAKEWIQLNQIRKKGEKIRPTFRTSIPVSWMMSQQTRKQLQHYETITNHSHHSFSLHLDAIWAISTTTFIGKKATLSMKTIDKIPSLFRPFGACH